MPLWDRGDGKPVFIGRWPLAGGPLPDELLSSYLVRAALANGAGAYRFGTLYWGKQPIWDRDIDRAPDAAWLADLAARSGMDRRVLDAASLRGLRHALGRTDPNGDTPFLLSASVFHRVRRRHGLQYCPACLAEGPAWYRRRWRLGFMLACDLHGTPLRDCCASCGAPVMPHRVWGIDAGRCHRCDRTLAEASTPVEMPPALAVAFQQDMLALVTGDGPPAPIGPFPRSEAVTALRTLLGLATLGYVRLALRPALGLAGDARSPSRQAFEHARWVERVALMETVAAWIADWPQSFRRGALEAGLTRRSFARLRLTPTLAEEVDRLPDGQRRQPSLSGDTTNCPPDDMRNCPLV